VTSRPLRWSAWIAISFGVFLVFGETRRNWGAWGHPASYAFDYLFAVLLVLFGALTLRGRRAARVALAISWALTIALFTWSFQGHVRSLDRPTTGPVPHLELTVWIGALDLVALVGLVLVLRSFLARDRL
jgi:uncharacterized protein with PQ loop repeat